MMARQSRIVVINDYPAFLDMLNDALSEEGYEVCGITKYQDAFEQVKQFAPDLIVLDLVLGNAQIGWELLDMIKFDPETSRIPVLLCSAATKEVREIAPSLVSKGIEYLEKPFELDTFLRKLTRMLEPQGAE